MKKIAVVLLAFSLLQFHLVPPWAGPTATIEQQARTEIQGRTQKAEQAKAHDQESNQQNLTRCNVLSDKTESKYQQAQQFYTTYKKQLLKQIRKKQRRLDKENRISDRLERQINHNAGSQLTQGTQLSAHEIAKEQAALKKQMNDLKPFLNLHKARCENTGRDDDGGEICTEYKRIKEQYRRAKRKHNYLGTNHESQRGNIIGSQQDIAKAHKKNEQGAFAQSGCSRWNPSTGQCLGLTGPVFEQNEALKALVNQGTAQAAKFAQIQSEQLILTEMKNAHNADYILFEMAVKDYNTNETMGGYHRSVGKNSMISNIETIAEAGAAAKDLYCQPIDNKGKRIGDLRKNPKAYPDYADSKAYHLFRAAAATFLMSQINDTSYFADTAACMATEEFNKDREDTQVHTLERSTNLSEHLFANLCLRINPQDPALLAECHKYIDKIFGPNPKFKAMARTRESALEMFIAAHRAALMELSTKQKLVSTAHSQIKKGEKRVKFYTLMLALTVAAKLAAKALGISFDAKSSACAAASPTCSAFAYLKAQATKWWNFMNKYYIREIYYGIQIIRWKGFVKKWKKKLSYAQVHTHLACNQEKAIKETARITEYAQKAKEETAKKVKEEQQKILQNVSKALSYRPTSKEIPILISWENILNFFFPISFAQTDPVTTGALGLQYGTQGFHDFLIKRNRAWYLQAQDVSPHVNLKITTTPVDLSPLDSLKDYTDVPMKKEGFPIPETRVNTTKKMVDIITQNINNTRGSLEQAYTNMVNHKKLLEKTKKTLKLGKLGTGDLPQIPNRIPTAHCGVNNNQTQSFEFDASCSCQKTNSCASFQYPEIKNVKGEAVSDGMLAIKTANAVSSGNLVAAELSGKRLKQKNASLAGTSGKRLKQKNASLAGTRRKNLNSNKTSAKRNTTGDAQQKSVVKTIGKNKTPQSKNNPLISEKNASRNQSSSEDTASRNQSGSKDTASKKDNGKTTNIKHFGTKKNIGYSHDKKTNLSKTGQKAASIWEQFNTQEDLVMKEYLPTKEDLPMTKDLHQGNLDRRTTSTHSKERSKLLNRNIGIFEIISKRYKKSAYSALELLAKQGKR